MLPLTKYPSEYLPLTKYSSIYCTEEQTLVFHYFSKTCQAILSCSIFHNIESYRACVCQKFIFVYEYVCIVSSISCCLISHPLFMSKIAYSCGAVFLKCTLLIKIKIEKEVIFQALLLTLPPSCLLFPPVPFRQGKEIKSVREREGEREYVRRPLLT